MLGEFVQFDQEIFFIDIFTSLASDLKGPVFKTPEAPDSVGFGAYINKPRLIFNALCVIMLFNLFMQRMHAIDGNKHFANVNFLC